MILLDTSVVIDYLRGKDAKLAALLPRVAVAVCGLVRAEILCGARDAKHRTALLAVIATFHQVAIPDSLWDKAGDTLALLRTQGLTVPFADATIATLGIENNLMVCSRDPHFAAMQSVLPALHL